MEKLRDIDISDEELAQYFVEDKESANAFHPIVILNPKSIADESLEGALVLNSFNSICRWRRNRKYKKYIKNWNVVGIAAKPHLKIIFHGYDNVIPQNEPWLGKLLAKQKISKKFW